MAKRRRGETSCGDSRACKRARCIDHEQAGCREPEAFGAEAQQLDALHRPPLFLDMLLLMRASGIAGQYCGSERGGNLRTHGGDSFPYG